MKIGLNILFAIVAFSCFAQKQGSKWYFGLQSGLDFSSGTPVILSNGQTGTDLTGEQEGTTCISDSAGNLLFYTGGKTLWNRNHSPMPNGTGLMGETSSTQSSIIIPLPGSDTIFYVFTSDKYQSYNNPPEKGYRYSVVNMCMDNSNGDVITGQKNILLLDSSTEKLAACEDASANGYWVVGHKMFSNEFNAWHLTSAGIASTVISNIGTIHGWNSATSNWINGSAQGQMKFNSAGTKLALAIGNFDPAYLDLFDFDNNTGMITNSCHMVIDSVFYKRIYGIEFSPDGTKLYTTVSGGSGGKRVYQFDLTAGGGNCNSIIGSRTTLFQSNANSVMLGMQLAPNGKIYLVGNSFTDLSCIDYPNLTGIAAGFDSSAIMISGTNNFTLPSFISGYKYHNNSIACSGENGIEEIKNSIDATLGEPHPNPTTGKVTLQYALPKGEKEGEIILYNTQGAEVKKYKVDDTFNDLLLDNTMLPAGVYYYQLQTSKGSVGSKKMVVVK